MTDNPQPTVPVILDAPGLNALAQHLDQSAPTIELTEQETIHDGGQLLAPDLDEYLAQTDAPYEWVVPDILETADRTIITGGEGAGKSTFFRQFGVQVASGIHPFTLEQIPPRRVLLIDCENSDRQLRRKLPPLRAAANSAYRTGHFRIRVAPNGLDLNHTEHVNHLVDVIAANKPEILMIGPIYKMISGDPTAEAPAREVSRVLDRLRNQFRCALLIEAHSPYAEGQKTQRPQRPYGASLWSRWPEFGLHLAKDGTLGHWRGPRDERDWPAKLTRGDGQTWPWMVPEGATEPWQPTDCMAAVVKLMAEIIPTELSSNEVVEALKERGSGFQKKTVLSALHIAAENDDLTVRQAGKRLMYRIPDTDRPSLETDEDDETF